MSLLGTTSRAVTLSDSGINVTKLEERDEKSGVPNSDCYFNHYIRQNWKI